MKTGNLLLLRIGFIPLVILIIVFAGCKRDDESPYLETNLVTDYSVASHWLSLPVNLKQADVFYVYPTAWYKVDDHEPDICAVDHPMMMEGARQAFARQATAFEAAGNVYAPFYRQADAHYTLSLPEAQRWQVIRDYPAKDVIAAFEYYLAHFNHGRPFILAGHSQGANVLLVLLSDYLGHHPDVYKRMIAAYVIGYPVTESYMASNKHLKFAAGPDDTGVIISYNTQSPKVLPGANPVVANNIGLVINPISWTRDETPAPASESLGSLMPDSTGQFVRVPAFADARIDLTKGVLICSSVNDSAMFRLAGTMGLGVYHSFDYPFYYFNLEENAIRRTHTYLGIK